MKVTVDRGGKMGVGGGGDGEVGGEKSGFWF